MSRPSSSETTPNVKCPDESDPPSSPEQAVYTTFTAREKRFIALVLGLTTITSPLTATIYFPLLPLLSGHLHVSSQAINLTITIYVIFQAVSPAIFATLSDSLGRRIIYLITLSLYLLANLGLALAQSSYTALLVLRALQSLGASAAYAVSYGVVADVCVPSERGSMVGPVSMALNLGTCVGPIVGGWVAHKSGGYVWVFWFLVIVGATLLFSVAGFLPETARKVVGNGKAGPKVKWWEKAWGSMLMSSMKSKMSKDDHERNVISDVDSMSQKSHRSFKILNPLLCLRIIFWKDAASILWIHSTFYLVDYSIQTAIPSAFKDVYHLNEFQIGLSYLPRSFGIIVGGYVNGRLMDWSYKVTAEEIGHCIDRERGDDLQHFPIERARSRLSWLLITILTCNLIGYGWAIEHHVHMSIPLILQIVQGFLGTCIYTTSSTLLVDVFPESPSTAAATASICRCALAALGVAIVQPLTSVLGRGWYFTSLGLSTGFLGLLALWIIQRWGRQWRHQRLASRDQQTGTRELDTRVKVNLKNMLPSDEKRP